MAAPKKVNKSAITGKFVTKQEVEKHPKTTFVETTKKTSKKGK
jgi:hypothetical protein